jgi:tripartite-type tricarboxylate transporter receptor subunit TctC
VADFRARRFSFATRAGRIALAMLRLFAIAPVSFLLVSLALPMQTLAQSASDGYPSRPLRMIVTVPPGGAADFIARTVSQKLVESLGQPVLVENRAGASGTIAADAVVKAAPDGYTLLQSSITTHGIGPHILPKLPYDSFRDLAPVILLARLPLVMTVNASVPADSVRALVALATARPGQLTFASSGNGGAPHMAGELFKSLTGTALTHVPYRGSGPAVADLVSGQVQIMFDAAPALIGHIRSGKLRALAAASAERNRLVPDAPTFAELGIAGLDVSLWYGVMVPAATPRPVVTRLNQALAAALAAPDLRERFVAQGAEPGGGSPEAFAAFMRDEYARWGRVVREAGVKAD